MSTCVVKLCQKIISLFISITNFFPSQFFLNYFIGFGKYLDYFSLCWAQNDGALSSSICSCMDLKIYISKTEKFYATELILCKGFLFLSIIITNVM